MTSEETAPATEAPALPDFYTDPNSVLGDSSASWRYGKPPDYSKTRKVYAETKSMNHEAGSLPQLVENLVKNWEIEASFKTKLEDWRTVNHSRYTFSMNGGTPQKAQHMLNVGTYNAIIAPNEFYSPDNSDFASSHKTFKRMMPFFAWEVLEVYSGPPKVAFRWRHWGQMKNDYVGFNNQAEKVTAKFHGGWIDIQGITVADLDEDMKIVHLETWFDPMDMFRQIAPQGIVNKQPVNAKPTNDSLEKSDSDVISEDSVSPAPAVQEPKDVSEATKVSEDGAQTLADNEPAGPLLSHESSQKITSGGDFPEGDVEFMDAHERQVSTAAVDRENKAEGASVPTSSEEQCEPQGEKNGAHGGESISKTESHVLEKGLEQESGRPKIESEVGDAEAKLEKCEGDSKIEEAPIKADGGVGQVDSVEAEPQIKPDEGEAVATSKRSVETIITHEEMSRITPSQCPFLNGE